MQGIRPDAGVYPGFVGLNGRDVRSGSGPTTFSKRPPSNPGALSTPLKLPRQANPIPGTTTQPTINGSTTLTRIVEPVAGDWEKLAYMAEGDLVFIARPEATQLTSTGEDLADICTLKFLNDLLAKEENWLTSSDFTKSNYINRGTEKQRVTISGVYISGKKKSEDVLTLDIDESKLRRDHPLLVYVPDGIARVVDPEGTDTGGRSQTHLVYNVVAQGCCTVNNSTQKTMRADGNVQLTAEQIFDLQPEMNSALYLCLQLNKASDETEFRAKFRAEYTCVSGANLRRVTNIIRNNKIGNARSKMIGKWQMNQLNRQPMLQVASQKRNVSGMVESNTYNKILQTFATTVRMWRIGRVIDARAQPMSTNVADTFSPAIEAYIDIARVTLPGVAQVYMPFQSQRPDDTGTGWFQILKTNSKDDANNLKKWVKGSKKEGNSLKINAEYDEEEDIMLGADFTTSTNASFGASIGASIGASSGASIGVSSGASSGASSVPAVDQELLDKAKHSLGVHREWVDLFEATIPSMARPQFQTVVGEYKGCLQTFETNPKQTSLDGLNKSYEHICARARDSIEGSVQSAQINSTRLMKAHSNLTLPPLFTKATQDVHAALVTSIEELKRTTEHPVHSAPKMESPTENQKLDLSSFHTIHSRTEHLIQAVDRLIECDTSAFKTEYSTICKDLKLKELSLSEVYAPTTESSTYAPEYSGAPSRSASSSDEDGFLTVEQTVEKPRKRTPSRAKDDKKSL